MDSIYSGGGTLHIACTLALFILPVITFFQPFQPLALSVTMLATAYVCIQVGLEQLKSTVETGVAGVVAVVLALHGAVYAPAGRRHPVPAGGEALPEGRRATGGRRLRPPPHPRGK